MKSFKTKPVINNASELVNEKCNKNCHNVIYIIDFLKFNSYILHTFTYFDIYLITHKIN